MNYNFKNASSLLSLCDSENILISEAMIRRETECFPDSRENITGKMKASLSVMRESTKKALDGKLNLLGGFIGGESAALKDRFKTVRPMGGMISKAVMYAVGVVEYNASMGRIVAAPTAGASGVLPGVLISASEEFGFTDDELINALFNAGAVGYLIAANATISGAEGGCQAETGTAGAMAASALCELLGGSPRECLCAAGDAISNILGLVCDPVCGLVEYPCQKRNAMSAANAIVSCELALATGGRTLIPFDEIVAVMRNVGKSIPYQLRETALGGLASAPSAVACAACKRN